MKTETLWKPDGKPVHVLDEKGEELVRLRHTEPRPDKTVRKIASTRVDRGKLAKSHPLLAQRLTAEQELSRSCGHSRRVSLDVDPSVLTKMARSKTAHRLEERCGAIAALGYCADGEGADALIDMAGDRRESLAVRCAALLSLSNIGSRRAVATLERHLAKGHVALRRAAAKALGRSRTDSVYALERAAAEDDDAYVRRQAYASISGLERRVGVGLSALRSPKPPPRGKVQRDEKADALTRDGGRR